MVMNITAAINIMQLNNRRSNILAKNYDTNVDEITNTILDLIKEHRDLLCLEFILEELTKLGWCPNLIYDDNGHFAISCDSYGQVNEEVDDMTTTVFASKDHWKPTIREALNYFLDTK